MHYTNAETVRAVLADYTQAPIAPKLRVMLAFLERLHAEPTAVTAADLAPLRAEGLDDRAIAEAAYSSFLFEVMDRLADTFDFAMPTESDVAATVQILTKLGYGVGSIPG